MVRRAAWMWYSIVSKLRRESPNPASGQDDLFAILSWEEWSHDFLLQNTVHLCTGWSQSWCTGNVDKYQEKLENKQECLPWDGTKFDRIHGRKSRLPKGELPNALSLAWRAKQEKKTATCRSNWDNKDLFELGKRQEGSRIKFGTCQTSKELDRLQQLISSMQVLCRWPTEIRRLHNCG